MTADEVRDKISAIKEYGSQGDYEVAHCLHDSLMELFIGSARYADAETEQLARQIVLAIPSTRWCA